MPGLSLSPLPSVHCSLCLGLCSPVCLSLHLWVWRPSSFSYFLLYFPRSTPHPVSSIPHSLATALLHGPLYLSHGDLLGPLFSLPLLRPPAWLLVPIPPLALGLAVSRVDLLPRCSSVRMDGWMDGCSCVWVLVPCLCPSRSLFFLSSAFLLDSPFSSLHVGESVSQSCVCLSCLVFPLLQRSCVAHRPFLSISLFLTSPPCQSLAISLLPSIPVSVHLFSLSLTPFALSPLRYFSLAHLSAFLSWQGPFRSLSCCVSIFIWLCLSLWACFPALLSLCALPLVSVPSGVSLLGDVCVSFSLIEPHLLPFGLPVFLSVPSCASVPICCPSPVPGLSLSAPTCVCHLRVPALLAPVSFLVFVFLVSSLICPQKPLELRIAPRSGRSPSPALHTPVPVSSPSGFALLPSILHP